MVVACCKALTKYLLGESEGNMRILSQDSQTLGQKSHLGSPE